MGETSLNPDRTLVYDTTHAVFLYGEIVPHQEPREALFALQRPTTTGVPTLDFNLVHQALCHVVRSTTADGFWPGLVYAVRAWQYVTHSEQRCSGPFGSGP